MKSFRKTVAVLLFIVLGFPLAMGGMSAVSAKKWAKDPSLWKALVHDKRVDAILASGEPALMAPPKLFIGPTALDGAALVQSALSVVDAPLLQSTADKAIDAVFSGGKVDSVDLSALKAALAKGSGTIASEYIRLSGEKKLTVKILQPAIAKKVADMPASAPLASKDGGVRLSVVNDLRSVDQAAYALLGLAAGVLVAAAFIAKSRWKDRSVFLGTTIMIPGLVILIIGFLPYLFTPTSFLKGVTSTQLSSLPLTLDYIRFVFASIGSGFRVTGIAAVVLAVGFLSARFVHVDAEDGDE